MCILYSLAKLHKTIDIAITFNFLLTIHNYLKYRLFKTYLQLMLDNMTLYCLFGGKKNDTFAETKTKTFSYETQTNTI